MLVSQDPAPHRGADAGVRVVGKIVSEMEGFKRPVILAFTHPWMLQDPVYYPTPGAVCLAGGGGCPGYGQSTGGVHDWAGWDVPVFSQVLVLGERLLAPWFLLPQVSFLEAGGSGSTLSWEAR